MFAAIMKIIIGGFHVIVGGGERDRELRLIPAYPVRSITIIAIDVAVIWAPTARGCDNIEGR
jgi:hypothetical protein